MNLLLKTLVVAAGTTFGAVPLAHADLAVSFIEGAPKDRFTFSNTGKCTIQDATVTLDLSGSKAGLIFDVTSSGAGVQVFQPLDITNGTKALKTTPKVRDGDNQIVLKINRLIAGNRISFTIDVDDTMGGREITVSGSEIAGARVRFAKNGKSKAATFGSNARTVVALKDCGL